MQPSMRRRWLHAAGFLVLAAGCGALPQFGEPPLIGPPDYLIARLEPVGIDSTATLVIPDDVAHPPPRRARAPETTTSPVAESPPDSTQVELTEPVPGSTSGLSIELSELERARISTAALQDLDATEDLLYTMNNRTFSGPDAEKLRTVHGLITQARTALDTDDLQAAANLARKARLLAVELSNR